MTTAQKTIKYCALAFAIFLIVAIFSGIIRIIYGIGDAIFGDSAKMDKYVYLIEESNLNNYEANSLIIDVKATNIKIVKGGTFSIQTNNKNIKFSVDGEDMIIKDKTKGSFHFKTVDTELIIEVPSVHKFEKVSIDSGAGKVNIQDLKVNRFDLDLGAGSLNIKNVIVDKNTKIEGGAGSITIEDAAMNNLDLDIGTGSFKYTGTITGISNIECGVGETKLNLAGKLDDYQLHLEKGIGSITVDNKSVENDRTIGNGDNTISIDGGVGSIKVNFYE